MSDPTQFGRFAALCMEMAQDASPDRRAKLIHMADAWRRLAEDAERFDRLVQELDQAFEAPSPEMQHRPHRRSH
jgi:hypothetical protein